MKLLIIAASLLMIGCGGNREPALTGPSPEASAPKGRMCFWLVERTGVDPAELQRRHNIMAIRGWNVVETGIRTPIIDGAVFYEKWILGPGVQAELEALRKELESR